MFTMGTVLVTTIFIILTFIHISTTVPVPSYQSQLQKYLEQNKYQVVSGPKEFLRGWNNTKSTDIKSEKVDNSQILEKGTPEFLMYGRLYVFKRKRRESNIENLKDKSNVLAQASTPSRLQSRSLASNTDQNRYKEAIQFPPTTPRSTYRRRNLYWDPYGYSSEIPVTAAATDTLTTSTDPEMPTPSTSLPLPMIETKELPVRSPSIIIPLKRQPSVNEENKSSTLISTEPLIYEDHNHNDNSTNNDDENYSEETTTESELSFHTLMEVPKLTSCPAGERRNHNGKCVRKYVHSNKTRANTNGLRKKIFKVDNILATLGALRDEQDKIFFGMSKPATTTITTTTTTLQPLILSEKQENVNKTDTSSVAQIETSTRGFWENLEYELSKLTS